MPACCKQTGPITIHCATKLSAQCNKSSTYTVLMAIFQVNLWLTQVHLENGRFLVVVSR